MSDCEFDDNGNPITMDQDRREEEEMNRDHIEIINGEEEEEEIRQRNAHAEEEDNEPTYFINAAALSDEEGGLECMAGSRSEFSQPLVSSTVLTNNNDPSEDENSEIPSTSEHVVIRKSSQSQLKQQQDQDNNSVLFEKVNRCNNSSSGRVNKVPISRSFPDIIQTTMTEKFYKMDVLKQNLQNFKVEIETVANNKSPTDSLEELVDRNETLQAVAIPPLANEAEAQATDRLTENEPIKPEPKFNLEENSLLTSSVMGGITNEKPPDSWTIDFNSLSIEDSLLTDSTNEPRNNNKSSSSNSNSLAFFVDMNEPLPIDEKARKMSESSDDSRKIFPLFIDFGGEKGKEKENSNNDNKAEHHHHQHYHNHHHQRHSSGNSNNGGGRIAASASSVAIAKDATYKKYGSGYNNYNYNNKGMIPISKGSSINNRLEFTGKHDALNTSTISNRSSLHVANHDLDDMFTSNLLSSMENSMPDEDMDSCLKLGMDLLRMFQEGINTDVQISVKGRFIKAHKCILASRSQYFAAILSGNMIEKTGNKIHLDEFSYSVVQFTLYHIYSGTNEIPDSIDLIELTSLTDVLGLEGLREIISNTIKAKFAHNFHRPCSTCIIGVVQFFPIAITYGMDDLSRKMTKWISKHFVRIWPTKAFASLGDDLIEKCVAYTVNHLSGENLLDITLGCDQLLNTMPNIKWAETIFNIVHQLMDACVQFVGQNLCQVLQSQRFLVFGKGQSWNISRIESTFTEGLKLLKPDDACLSYSCLTRLIELGTETFDEAFVDFLVMLQKEIEKYLLANASKAVLSKNWERLSEKIRKKICSTGFLGYDSAATAKKAQQAGKVLAATSGGGNTSSRQSQSQKGTTANTNSRPTSSTSARNIPNTSTMTKSTWKAAAQKSDDASSASYLLDIVTTPSSTREILSPTDASKTAKVASVRPMPAQVQHQNVFSSRQTTSTSNKPTTSLRATAANNEKSFNSSRLTSKTTTLGQNRLGGIGTRLTEREKSFDNISRSPSSSSSSFGNLAAVGGGSGSQSKPMTPITPSRPKQFPHGRNLKLSPRLDDKPAPITKPVFLTNSEKAKAVSKPQLKMRSARSNSISSTNIAEKSSSGSGTSSSAIHSRQSSMGSNQVAPRTPNLSQPSRYTTNMSGTSRKTLTQANVAASSNSPTTFTNRRVGSATGATRKSTSSTVFTPAVRDRDVTSRGRQQQNSSSKTKSNVASNNKGYKKQTIMADYDSGSDSDLMTKSNIEIDGEPRMRTLAEIGRSSTFSKDEPTVLGKMDLSLDMEYNPI